MYAQVDHCNIVVRGLCGCHDNVTCNRHMMAGWIASFVFLEIRTSADVCCSEKQCEPKVWQRALTTTTNPI